MFTSTGVDIQNGRLLQSPSAHGLGWGGLALQNCERESRAGGGPGRGRGPPGGDGVSISKG